MARRLSPPKDASLAYYGEVWTDGRGYATVRLPPDAGALEPPLAYELHDLDPQSRARVTAELENGHFTIATDEPHVKVAWRISGRAAGEPSHRQQRAKPSTTGGGMT